MASLIDFIHIHDNILDELTCNTLIEFFEATSGKATTINLTDNRTYSEEIDEIHKNLLKSTIDFKKEYYEYCSSEVFPESNSFEKFTITKIKPSEDNLFTTNLDVVSYDEARRYLCFTYYLNYNSAGQTNFLDLTIQPEIGRLVIYPPFWLFPYQEMSPVETPIYKVKTYLHYK